MPSSIPKSKRLIVIFRIEPGCLGPDGADHIEDFCEFARDKIQSQNQEILHWVLIPRYDKSLPELEYQIASKKLTETQAWAYLSAVEQRPEEFEDWLHQKLADFVDEYFSR